MRQPQSPSTGTAMRLLVAVVVGAAALGASGCSWFHHKTDAYQLSAEQRPLEVPPDLDLPDTGSAMQLPEQPRSVTRSSMTRVANNGFNVAGDPDAVFDKVGTALAAIDGVTIASKAQLLGAYDVSYQGSNFLVRVSKGNNGSYVSAVDPRGVPATGSAATALVAALKTALGG